MVQFLYSFVVVGDNSETEPFSSFSCGNTAQSGGGLLNFLLLSSTFLGRGYNA